jgi:hypothetical protein
MSINVTKRARALTVSLAALASVGFISVGPAEAATTVYVPDNCGYSDAQFFNSDTCSYALSIYYHQDGGGAFATLFGDVPDYSSTVIGSDNYDYIFYYMAGTSTDGATQGVRNNAASVYNTSPSMTYVVYYYPAYSGHAQTFGPTPGFVNFDSTLRNADASQNWH